MEKAPVGPACTVKNLEVPKIGARIALSSVAKPKRFRDSLWQEGVKAAPCAKPQRQLNGAEPEPKEQRKLSTSPKRDAAAADERLLAFQPPPAVLIQQGLASLATQVLATSEGDARVQMALLAQRVLSQMRTSHDGRAVHLRVDLGKGREVDVRLHHENGRVSVRIHADTQWAGLFAESLCEKGIPKDLISIE
ncbi:MAG: hypothetical protein IPK60_16630 [Sandaracinaceae bacterium]|jgi:hypothetical protein|nr:hypothetical protein [Sandaracinaceae bacterium]